MKRTIKRLWLKALESGRYKQGQESLRSGSRGRRFCCLGVLCDLYSRAEKIRWKSSAAPGGNYSIYGEEHTLPVEVMNWAGLLLDDPFLGPGFGTRTASQMNDSGGTFKDIAKAIREQL